MIKRLEKKKKKEEEEKKAFKRKIKVTIISTKRKSTTKGKDSCESFNILPLPFIAFRGLHGIFSIHVFSSICHHL